MTIFKKPLYNSVPPRRWVLTRRTPEILRATLPLTSLVSSFLGLALHCEETSNREQSVCVCGACLSVCVLLCVCVCDAGPSHQVTSTRPGTNNTKVDSGDFCERDTGALWTQWMHLTGVSRGASLGR